MSPSKKPFKISIITPVLNAASTIEQCVNSVLKQAYTDVEHIIIDGGSEDGTQEKLSRYAIESIKVFSQPSYYIGASGALNYGISIATGNIIVLLCADDWFENNIFNDVVTAFSNNDTVDIVSCGEQILQFNNKKNAYTCIFYLNSARQLELNFNNICKGFSAISCRFFSRSFFNKVGYFISVDNNKNYIYSNDKEFLLRAILFNPQHYIIPKIGHTTLFHTASLNFNENPKIRTRLLEEHIYIADKIIALHSLSLFYKNKLVQWKIQQRILLFLYNQISFKELIFNNPKKIFNIANVALYLQAAAGLIVWKIEIFCIRLRSLFVNRNI